CSSDLRGQTRYSIGTSCHSAARPPVTEIRYSAAAIPTSPAVWLDRRGDAAVIIIDNPPVNASSAAVRQGLMAALRQVGAEASCVVVAGARSEEHTSELQSRENLV